MKALSLFFLLFVCAGWSQSALIPAGAAPDTVVATFEDGTRMTVGEFQALVPSLPQDWQSLAERDPERFLHVYGVMLKGTAVAKDKKLAEREPYKQELAFVILKAMSDFAIRDATSSIAITPEEIQKFYDANKEPFRRVTVSVIEVGFGGSAAPPDAGTSTVLASRPVKKILTEEEAKTKAEKLLADIRGGADFAKLVLLESDDPGTKAKGGLLGTFGMADNVPQDFRQAVLGLQAGEVGGPVRQSGGYFLLHADSITYSPLADVKDSIFSQLQAERARQWVERFDKSTNVEFPIKKTPAPTPAASSGVKK